MGNRATSLREMAFARGRARFTQARGPLFASILAVALSGCAASPKTCPTRTEIQRVEVPVFIDLPGSLIEPLPIPPLPAGISNRDLEADTRALEDVIDRAQADRAEIRRIQRRRHEVRQ